MTTALVLLIAIVVIVAALSFAAPTRIAYRESIDIAAPPAEVYDHIRLQERLMQWSAWPEETNSTCALEGEDGTVGAKTVFFTKGKRTGHQEITALNADDQVVRMTLVGPGPPHHPDIAFVVEPAPKGARVHLDFTNRFPRPFNAIWKFAGLSTWTRRMHVKDLAGLKAFAEARTGAR
ncbi:MAG: SRPBCC family protein [Shimia sp.]